VTLVYSVVDTLIGTLTVAGTEDAVHEIHFGARRESDAFEAAAGAALREAAAQLRAYFAGELREFDLPLAPAGTEFQRSVWSHLRGIPYAETTTYGAIARAIGRPAAVRAVGAANGANPLPLVVPCHRVIGSNGALTGFGGGIEVKRWLLDHEARVARRRLF
jgi:methylated-DNA-[protein]-cysteine S-methyltransferase